MTSSTEQEQRLAEVLRAEAARAVPGPVHGWSAISARVARRSRREPSRQRARGVVAALLALTLVAASVVFVATGGLHREPVPAQTPTALPTPGTVFAPSTPRASWNVYRPGKDGLYLEAARATPPYEPRQALDALFDQTPLAAGATTLPGNARNRVASLALDGRLVRLDLAAVDDVSRPEGPGARAQAQLWVQAWVRTAQEAFDDFLPVLITLDGRPTTLYGSVDTSKPFFGAPQPDLHQPSGVWVPRDGERVTSPVSLAATSGGKGRHLLVSDRRSGTVVLDAGADVDGDGQAPFSRSLDLPPGDYRVDTGAADGDPRPSVDFTVTGPASTGPRLPVTVPTPGEVASTRAYWPRGDGKGLAVEPHERTTLRAAVETIGADYSATNDQTNFVLGSYTISSVTQHDDRVVVDYSARAEIPVARDEATARLWAQSLVHTVDAYLGDHVPVQVTLRGRPFRLFDRLDTTQPFIFEPVTETVSGGLTEPVLPKPAGRPVPVLGNVDRATPTVTWYLRDRVTQETLVQGTAPVAADRSFGFSVPAPSAGRYEMRVVRPQTGSTPAAEYATVFSVG